MESPSRDALNEHAPLPHKLAAILYADVQGYSRLTGADEAGTQRILSAYLDLFAETIKAHRGEVKHYAGDAVLSDFTTVSDALNCAVAVQQAIKEKNQVVPEDKRVQFRIGLNLGEVIVDHGEVYGNGVNVAARLETLAEPGGVFAYRALRMIRLETSCRPSTSIWVSAQSAPGSGPPVLALTGHTLTCDRSISRSIATGILADYANVERMSWLWLNSATIQ